MPPHDGNPNFNLVVVLGLFDCQFYVIIRQSPANVGWGLFFIVTFFAF